MADVLDVALIRLPHLANFTDFDPLALEPAVSLRYVTHAGGLGDPDLLVLPGSKATVADLAWLRERGFDTAIGAATRRGSTLVGICAGYQMLGTTICDEVESGRGEVAGLGLLDSRTVFHPDKCTRQRRGLDASGTAISGYEIHHGQPAPSSGYASWFVLDDGGICEQEGVADVSSGIWATSLHGIFECDALRRSFLAEVAERRGKALEPAAMAFDAHRQAEIDRVADGLEEHLDLAATLAIIAQGAAR